MTAATPISENLQIMENSWENLLQLRDFTTHIRGFLTIFKKKTVNMEDLMGRRKLYQIVLNGVYDGMQSEKSSNLGINHGREIPELGAMDRVE